MKEPYSPKVVRDLQAASAKKEADAFIEGFNEAVGNAHVGNCLKMSKETYPSAKAQSLILESLSDSGWLAKFGFCEYSDRYWLDFQEKPETGKERIVTTGMWWWKKHRIEKFNGRRWELYAYKK